MHTDRRKFLQKATQLAAGLSLASLPGAGMTLDFSPAAAAKVPAANETVRVGLIGCRNMGWADLTSLLKHPGVACLALCDVDSNILSSRAAELEKKTGSKPLLYSDYRKLLQHKDIEARRSPSGRGGL